MRGPSGRGASYLAPATRPERFFTNHETRDTAFFRDTAFTVHRPSDISTGANQAPANGFHATRDTRHESRVTRFFKHETQPERKLPWSNSQAACLGSEVANHKSRTAACKVFTNN